MNGALSEHMNNMNNVKMIECENCKKMISCEEIQKHVKEKHAVRWVIDSILCLTEGIARIETMISDKFDHIDNVTRLLPKLLQIIEMQNYKSGEIKLKEE